MDWQEQEMGGMDMTGTIGTGYATEAGYGGIQSPSVNGREISGNSFSDTMAEKFCLHPKDMSLSEYKLYFHDKIKNLYTHPSQKRVDWFIDITDAAYRRMQADPAYERQVLDFLARHKAANWGCRPPKFAFLHVDDTLEKCYGYTFGLQEDSRARRAAERRRIAAERAKKARRKKLLKEYLKKRAQAKRLLDKHLKEQRSRHLLEQTRLTKEWFAKKEETQDLKERTAAQRRERAQTVREWSEARQAAQAFNAYEASLIMIGRYEDQLL